MTINVSRRSLLALGAGLGATTMLGGSALARAPKLGTQTPYWHRFMLGDAEVTVVSDGPLTYSWDFQDGSTATPPAPMPSRPGGRWRSAIPPALLPACQRRK